MPQRCLPRTSPLAPLRPLRYDSSLKYFPFSLFLRLSTNTTAPPSAAKYDLPKAYEFAEVEERWYQFWLEHKTFSAKMEPGRPAFSIVIPPPNVTGVLHIGHALNTTLQDVLTRYHRMKEDNTLWVPGTDHAGIATQNVVERQLAAEKTNRHELGRDKFIERGIMNENAGKCYRCATVVEPMTSKQWFVSVRPLADKAVAAVREGRIRLYPDTWYNTFYAWMDNIRDWCISRQIWWGVTAIARCQLKAAKVGRI